MSFNKRIEEFKIKTLIHKQLDFRLWSWGKESSVRSRIHNITVAEFLPYYYGYVSVTDK